jgi:hypothetical protein
MKPTRQRAIRKLLLEHIDGLTKRQISEMLGFNVSNINTTIKAMPDVYVDRWTIGGRGQYQKIFCIVYVPEDCPHPKDMVYKGGRGKPSTKWVTIK